MSPARVHPTVTFQQVDPRGPTVRALLGEGVATPTGDGGWAIVPRPKWVGFTTWEGIDPYRMTIPILFDGFMTTRSVEWELEVLRQMMRPASTPTTRAPIIRLAGPVPFTHFRWVIENITYNAAIKRQDGARVRQFLDVSVLQYIPADILVSTLSSPAESARARAATTGGVTSTTATVTTPAPSSRTYTVKAGDTLSAIAARVLGDYKRWPEIATLNGIRDPKALRIGQVLRLP